MSMDLDVTRRGSAGGLQPLAGRRIRVLVVDDSVVIRSIISQALGMDSEMEVLGVACDGAEAVLKVDELRPDVVTLDVEMPRLDGIGALRAIRAKHPRIKVVMLSSLTERGAETTIDALMEGANDYVAKPRGRENGFERSSIDALGRELADKIKQMFGAGTPRVMSPPEVSVRKAMERSPLPGERDSGGLKMLAIGVSTGGPSALAEILPLIPGDFPLPIAVVQHMPANFTTMLAARLDKICNISVMEGRNGMSPRAGVAIFAPGDYHMRIVQGAGGPVVRMSRDEQENSCRPAVDVLFRSVAETYGGAGMGLVLTGMGQDGLKGAQMLKACGGAVLAQDRASSAVWGMPRAIIEANLADKILGLTEIVPELMRRVYQNRR